MLHHSKLQLQILQRGLKQKTVAELCGFSAPRLSDYIHGTRPLPPRHIMLLCNVLDCNPEDITGVAESTLERKS